MLAETNRQPSDDLEVKFSTVATEKNPAALKMGADGCAAAAAAAAAAGASINTAGRGDSVHDSEDSESAAAASAGSGGSGGGGSIAAASGSRKRKKSIIGGRAGRLSGWERSTDSLWDCEKQF
eukprot:SAG22_NODE_2745_length_2257_cov_1.690918_3_plen_123_part_00